jgi:hypothetical protein
MLIPVTALPPYVRMGPTGGQHRVDDEGYVRPSLLELPHQREEGRVHPHLPQAARRRHVSNAWLTWPATPSAACADAPSRLLRGMQSVLD